MKQSEKPGISPDTLKRLLGLAPETRGFVGGGQFENFRAGWAIEIMNGSRVAHWFERGSDFQTAKALCSQSGAVRWLYGPGTYPRCANCIRTMSARIKSGRL